jgi:hypothetical protein
MAGIERKIFVAIRCVFAYSEGSSAGSGAGGTLPIGNPGLPEKACNSVVLWAFVSLPDAAARKGSKTASVRLRVLEKNPFVGGRGVRKKQLALCFSFLASITNPSIIYSVVLVGLISGCAKPFVLIFSWLTRSGSGADPSPQASASLGCRVRDGRWWSGRNFSKQLVSSKR